MKKKIINGILMSALLLAGTTSFVSCKDNVDDVETGMRTDMSALQTQISTLESKLNSMTQQVYDDTELRNKIKAIQDELDLAELSILANSENINTLTDRVNELAEQIAKLQSTVVTGVIVQETLDRIVGTINLPGFTPGYLAAFVGENLSGMPEFPIAGDDYNVDPDGNVLKNSEINVDPVWNSGKKSYLVNGIGNAGKIYFTINPRKVDASTMQFDLINSTGEVSPISLSEVKPSNHLITFNIGKHGNGLTRADEAAEKTYLYEANATVSLEGIEKIHFDWTKFGFQNLWDAGKEITGQTQSADANAQNMFGRFLWLANNVKNVKNETTTGSATGGVLDGALKILQDFYNGLYTQRDKLQKQALRVSWNNGENDVISDFDITTVTINPLNWKQMVLLDNMKPEWDLTRFDNLAIRMVSAIKKAAGLNGTATSVNFSGLTSGIDFSTLSNIPVTLTVSGGGVGTGATATGSVDLSLFKTELETAVKNGINVTALETQVNNLLKPYQKLANATGSSIMTRVNDYLKKATDKFYKIMDYQPAYRLTEPMVLFESNYGINRLEEGMTLGGTNAKGNTYTFIMTSLTEEYIVPVYMKYIALLVGGQVRQSYLLPGSEKIVSFDIPGEPCEIVYQASDFYGNVVTKRYPINYK